ncbi:1-acyl-sn-glycerol-3-phosphate acyltransferase [Candidatus Velamenicoccus archaeovorus]|uniref:1-acyl-sn-glycerol-3-phosphate acyltransferase n=1 Tax=Velamenicoccus archaeovorus TaxID=1930593 RepID=A0A410P296_VELA1|nr:lysophospholipid acyltransferase family protein [Candidatus Velamenicoccus archaeovorus]QAT16315.1 1-acyl-sn-glycerol-3-phosphate acyltransferase [Candidatus Velamenicoccus archaeovorus]
MRRLLKLIPCVVCFIVFLLAACLVRLSFFVLRPKRRWAPIACLNRALASCFVRLIGVRMRLVGSRQVPAGGLFLVSNHVGYLDGFVLGALSPLIYTSKSELKRWPLIGAMTELSGTLFIDRQRKNHISEYIDDIAGVLRQGVNVLFFPEGTSTNGDKLLPFKSAFFEAPLKAGCGVVPVTLRYRALDGRPLTPENRGQVYWYGEMTFMDHFFRLLGHRSIDVDVVIHETISLSGGSEKEFARKDLSERAFATIASSLCAPVLS